jgi:hypothetical protein
VATTFLAADPIQNTFLIPGGNSPGNGVQLFCYAAGSTTKTTVYKDNAGGTAWSNPIVLDSGGNLPGGAQVWQSQGQSMKYVYAPSNDTDPPASPYRTLDNMPGVNDVTAQTGVEWLTGPTPTFVGTTQFTLVGDQTANFTVGRRVKTTNTGGTIYSTIVGSSFGANTTVNVVNDSGVLDSGLSAVSYGLFNPNNVSISPAEVNRKGANVASTGGATTNIWGIVGDYAHVTGTNNINNFSSAPYAGAERTVIFDGVLTLLSSAALATPGSVNITTAANDRAVVRADTVSSAIITQYTRAAIAPLGVGATFTLLSSGVAQIYTPPPGTARLYIRMVGGGAGSGNATPTSGTQGAASGGGGSGAYTEKWIASPATSYTYTVGAGGGATLAGSTTSFSTATALITAPGGSPGAQGTSSNTAAIGGIGGVGGVVGANGDFMLPGNDGGYGVNFTTSNSVGGTGASSLLGGAVTGVPTVVQSLGVAGKLYGGGAAGAANGASQGTAAGAAGATGAILIYEIYE